MRDIAWALSASDEEVGPACMNLAVPVTIADDPQFREAYEQGYRHAVSDVRNQLDAQLRTHVAPTKEDG